MRRRLPVRNQVVRSRTALALSLVVGLLASVLSTSAVAGVPGLGQTADAAPTEGSTLRLPDGTRSRLSADLAADPAPASRAWRRGECHRKRGVTVVLDFRSLDRRKLVRCVRKRVGRNFDGLDALQTVGVRVRGVDGFGKSFACRLEGRPRPREDVDPGPGRYREKCRRIPPKSAYWSYWYARDGGRWRYSTVGLTSRHVIRGGFEGWSFHAGRGDAKPPRKRPNRPGRVEAPDSGRGIAGRSVASTDSSTDNSTDNSTGPSTITASTGFRPVGLTAPAVPAAASNASTEPPAPAARRAAEWLLDELDSGRLPGPGGRTDWGLTIDALLALRAAGVGDVAQEQIVHALAEGVDAYLGPAVYRDPRARIAGATAKTLVAAVAADIDTARIGGYRLRDELLALMQGPGERSPGRFSDRRTGVDSSNTVSQALAVIGLSHSGGVPEPALAYLQRQQCPAGWFRMYGDQGRSCGSGPGPGSPPDTDGTSMALQALLTARAAGTSGLGGSIRNTVAWLVRQQAPDGSFGGGELTSSHNANSTGLAAQALEAAGRQAAAANATRWLRSVQLDRAASARAAAQTDQGAVAYDQAALRGARSGVVEPIARDQWRRATAQAVLGLSGSSFVDLGDDTRIGAAEPVALSSSPAASDDGSSWLLGGLAGLTALVALGAAAVVVRRIRRRPGLPA